MTSALIEEAKKERAMLTAQLEKSELFRRLTLVNKFIADYTAKKNINAELINTLYAENSENSAVPKTKEGKIEYYSRQCIKNNGGFAPMGTIHSYIEANGLKISRPNLSAYLSGFRKKDFDFEREKGWFIK